MHHMGTKSSSFPSHREWAVLFGKGSLPVFGNVRNKCAMRSRMFYRRTSTGFQLATLDDWAVCDISSVLFGEDCSMEIGHEPKRQLSGKQFPLWYSGKTVNEFKRITLPRLYNVPTFLAVHAAALGSFQQRRIHRGPISSPCSLTWTSTVGCIQDAWWPHYEHNMDCIHHTLLSDRLSFIGTLRFKVSHITSFAKFIRRCFLVSWFGIRYPDLSDGYIQACWLNRVFNRGECVW